MENGGDDAILSDVEAEEHDAALITASFSRDESVVSVERYHEIIAALDRERDARQAAEDAKSDLQTSFNRLKVLVHEAIKKRDEAVREKEEALRLNEKSSADLSDALREKDEVLKQRENLSREVKEAVNAHGSLRSEIDSATRLLARGIDKISGKIVNVKNFSGGLPTSPKFTGLPALAYGVIKRTNEIVDELLKQHEAAKKARNDIGEQMEQRNYEIAIEISELEAKISRLKDDLHTKSCQVENLQRMVAERDEKVMITEREFLDKLHVAESMAAEFDSKSRNLEKKFESQKPLIVDQLSCISKVHNQLCEIIRMIDAGKLDHVDVTESLFLPSDVDMEENIRTSLAGITSIQKLGKIVTERVKIEMEATKNQVKGLNDTIFELVNEKQYTVSMLRRALSVETDLPVNEPEGVQSADEETELGIRSDHIPVNDERPGFLERTGDEIYMLASSVEKLVKASHGEIIELQHSLEALRTESNNLNGHLEAQAKELSRCKQYVKELETKERAANESVEGLMVDISAAEEEITRWKMAAEQEAAAGKAVEHEFQTQISALRQEAEEARQAISELENKLKFKEQTAAAAMAARDAAEKSLRLADLRASGLGERVDELTRQLENVYPQDPNTVGRHRYVCWPWQWLGLNFVGQQVNSPEDSNEMELSEPFL